MNNINPKTTGIFIDLDGTLLSDDYQISKFDLKTLNRIKQKEFKIYLVTGKSMHHALKFYNQLSLNTFLITSAGQVISKNEKIVWEKSLKSGAINSLLNDLEIKIILNDFLIQTNNSIYASNSTSPLIQLFYEENFKIKPYITSTKIKNIVGLYLNIKYEKNINLWDLITNLNQKWKNNFEFHPWEILNNVIILHVVAKKINKWSGMKKIIAWDRLEYVISFGNGRNDIPMLKNSNLSFAMKNATTEVKFYAKKITKFDNNNSGVGKECLDFLA